LRKLLYLLVLLLLPSFAYAGGSCPTSANYLPAYSSSSVFPETLVTLASLGVTNCYYIAANGSDSNDGLSEANGHPWAHLPGMSTCTGNCAALTPSANMGFILRGGDTWSGSNLGIVWKWGGSSNNPIYIGVDPGWYSGSAWTRPVWTCGGTTCSGETASYFFNASQPYIILDNIEMTGLAETSLVSPAFVCSGNSNQTYENLYWHGWKHISLPTIQGKLETNARGFGCGSAGAAVYRYSVADGTDTSQDMMVISQGIIPVAYANVFRYVQTALDGCGDNWHDNLFEYMAPSVSQGGAHQDALFQYGPCSQSVVFMYNNVVRHVTWAGSGGAVKFWMSGNNANTATGYAFNNVIYDNSVGNIVDTGGHFAVNYGTWYFFNNTIQCGTDSAMGSCVLGDAGNKQNNQYNGGRMVLHLSNNHWITTGPVLTCVQATWTCTEINDVQQTLSRAKAQGYTSKSAYAFQPTSARGSTVGTGVTDSSLCTAVSAIDASAGTACGNATGYACSYNSTNHAVTCPALTPLSRGGTWDKGAYQYIGTRTVAPPTISLVAKSYKNTVSYVFESWQKSRGFKRNQRVWQAELRMLCRLVETRL
jgi:hypothetical protein